MCHSHVFIDSLQLLLRRCTSLVSRLAFKFVPHSKPYYCSALSATCTLVYKSCVQHVCHCLVTPLFCKFRGTVIYFNIGALTTHCIESIISVELRSSRQLWFAPTCRTIQGTNSCASCPLYYNCLIGLSRANFALAIYRSPCQAHVTHETVVSLVTFLCNM